MIKENKPKYNILLRDDKTYPYIAISKERFPKVYTTRKINIKKEDVFGPYTNVKSMRGILRLIKNLYKIRNCNYVLSEENIRSFRGDNHSIINFHIIYIIVVFIIYYSNNINIVEETGGSDGKGGIKGYKNLDFVYSYMQPEGQNPGAGAELQDLLNQFSNFVQDSVFLGDENSGVTDLAKNADQIPLYQDDLPNDPSFTSLNFGFGTSAGAGLATISHPY